MAPSSADRVASVTGPVTYHGAMTTTPKKTAAKAAIKAAPRKRAVPATKVEAPEAEAPKTIEFLGRTLQVKPPTAEQLLAWERLLVKLEKVAQSDATAETVRALFGRITRIIDSVVVDEEDREWLEDGRMDGTVTIENSSQIVLDALEAYGADVAQPANRAARRSRS